MHFIFPFIIFLFKGLFCFGQDGLPKQNSSQDVRAFIKGQKDQKIIDIDFLRAGFEIGLTDTSYKLVSCRVCWFEKDDDFVCYSLEGNSMPKKTKRFNLNDAALNSVFTVDAIIVIKDNKEFRIPALIVEGDDVFNKYITLKNPQICHDKYLRPVCYNDGTYIFQFEDSRFSGFTLADSTVSYNEKEKALTVYRYGNTKILSPITIRLEQYSYSFYLGNSLIAQDKITPIFSSIGDFDFRMGTGRFFDTINFRTGDKYFTIKVSKNISGPKKGWRWEIIEKHGSTKTGFIYNWKNNELANIYMQDERSKYGMSLSTTFKTSKRIWFIESSYVEEIDGVITTRPYVQQYRYAYNKSGKLIDKKSIGVVNFCSCQ